MTNMDKLIEVLTGIEKDLNENHLQVEVLDKKTVTFCGMDFEVSFEIINEWEGGAIELDYVYYNDLDVTNLLKGIRVFENKYGDLFTEIEDELNRYWENDMDDFMDEEQQMKCKLGLKG